MSLFFLLCLSAFALALVFALVINGWRVQLERLWKSGEASDPASTPMITVLVPMRNGGSTIAALLQDLHAQDLPKDRYEVIVIDDGSTDGGPAVARAMMRTWPQLQVVSNAGAGKKAAIAEGVRMARGELVLLTDDDVRCGPARLRKVAEAWPFDMLVLPVQVVGSGLLGALQANEQAALVGAALGSAGAGAPFLAYGANLAFARAAFHAVGGFGGDRYASGDDLFLLQRMRRAGRTVAVAAHSELVVSTQAESTWRGFWRQRLRWAGKMRGVGGAATWLGALGLALPYLLLLITLRFDLRAAAGQGLFRCALLLVSAWCLWLFSAPVLARRMRALLGRPASSWSTVLAFMAFSVYAPVIAVCSWFVRPAWRGRSA